VDVFWLIVPLVSCMLSIKLGFLLSRLLQLNRTMKVCVWSMGMLSTIILLTIVSSRLKRFSKIYITPTTIAFCGTNAHHQTFSNITRAMLLNASIHWKNNVESDLWPMAISITILQKTMLALQMFYMVV